MMTLQQAYDAQLRAGLIQEDSAQMAVLPELERIRAGLAGRAVRPRWFPKAPPAPLRGLYLWGGVGCGKSFLMDLLVRQLEIPKKRVHFHAFMQQVHGEMHAMRQKGVQDALAPVGKTIAQSARLLALDEMQISDIADAMIVGRLFALLFAGGMTVITTSNRPPEDLYRDGLNRALFLPFIDSLRQHMVVHELAGHQDYRRSRLQEAQRWNLQEGRLARTTMQGLWRDLTGTDDAAPLVLCVGGRKLEIPAFHNGVGRATFHDLCGSLLGPADYLALAESLRVLMLEDIPQLGRDNFNEAKRFVILIDALYEARVGLIASAAARPEMLYVEGSGAFEFERTVSRLHEMQHPDWGRQRPLP